MVPGNGARMTVLSICTSMASSPASSSPRAPRCAAMRSGREPPSSSSASRASPRAGARPRCRRPRVRRPAARSRWSLAPRALRGGRAGAPRARAPPPAPRPRRAPPRPPPREGRPRAPRAEPGVVRGARRPRRGWREARRGRVERGSRRPRRADPPRRGSRTPGRTLEGELGGPAGLDHAGEGALDGQALLHHERRDLDGHRAGAGAPRFAQRRLGRGRRARPRSPRRRAPGIR